MSDSLDIPPEVPGERAPDAPLSPAEARDLLIVGRFLAEAPKHGLRWADDALKLADLSGVDADLTSRSVSGLDAVFAALRQSRPWLFGAPGTVPGPEKAQDGFRQGELEALRERAAQTGSDADLAAFLRAHRQQKRRRR